MCKTEGIGIFIESCRDHFQIVQIGKDAFLTDACNAGHDRPVQIRICLEGCVKQISHKRYDFLPISVNVGLLHWRVVFIQQNNDFPAIIFH